MPKSALTPSFTPANIWYAGNGDANPVLTPVSEIEKIISKYRSVDFKWTETVLVNFNKVPPDQFCINRTAYAKREEFEAAMSEFYDSVYICYINDVVGFGLFARKKINAKTSVPYAGSVSLSYEKYYQGNADYVITIDNSLFIDSRKYGGLGSLFQHAPALYCNSQASDSAAISSDSQIGFANFSRSRHIISGIEYYHFEAARDIAPGDCLCIDYGSGYWGVRKKEELYLTKDKKVKPFEELSVLDRNRVMQRITFFSSEEAYTRDLINHKVEGMAAFSVGNYAGAIKRWDLYIGLVAQKYRDTKHVVFNCDQEKLPINDDIARCLWNVANAYFKAENYEKANVEFSKCIDLVNAGAKIAPTMATILARKEACVDKLKISNSNASSMIKP